MPALIPVDDTVGAAFIGTVLSAILFGVTCLQVYIYFTDHGKEDRTSLKSLVAALWVIDAVHLALVTHLLYYYTIWNFGDYVALVKVVCSLEVQVGVADLLTIIVQLFFAWRIYILSNNTNWWLPGLVVICSIGLAVGAIGFMVIGFQHDTFSNEWSSLDWSVPGLVCELVGDILITVGTTYYLIRMRSAYKETNRLVYTLIMYTVNTCLLTTVFTVVTLALNATEERQLIYTPFFFVLARLYSFSFMSTLNMRSKIRRGTRSQLSYLNIGTATVAGTVVNQHAATSASSTIGKTAEVFVSTNKYATE